MAARRLRRDRRALGPVLALGVGAFFASDYTLAQIDHCNWTSLNFAIGNAVPMMHVQIGGIPPDF